MYSLTGFALSTLRQPTGNRWPCKRGPRGAVVVYLAWFLGSIGFMICGVCYPYDGGLEIAAFEAKLSSIHLKAFLKWERRTALLHQHFCRPSAFGAEGLV
jgi:hypothetical protein